MKTRSASGRLPIIRSLEVTALACFGTLAMPAYADPPATSTLPPSELIQRIPLDGLPVDNLSLGESSLATQVSSSSSIATANSVMPRGNDMSALAGVELERTDRRFRSRVVDWAMDRSVAAGLATDFLLHGSDRGVHLRMPSRSEYVVRWETRF